MWQNVEHGSGCVTPQNSSFCFTVGSQMGSFRWWRACTPQCVCLCACVFTTEFMRVEVKLLVLKPWGDVDAEQRVLKAIMVKGGRATFSPMCVIRMCVCVCAMPICPLIWTDCGPLSGSMEVQYHLLLTIHILNARFQLLQSSLFRFFFYSFFILQPWVLLVFGCNWQETNVWKLQSVGLCQDTAQAPVLWSAVQPHGPKT